MRRCHILCNFEKKDTSHLGSALECYISSPEPKAPGELKGWDSSRRFWVRPSLRRCAYTLKHKHLLEQLANHYHISSGASLG